MPKTLIRLKNVWKTYLMGEVEVAALRDVSIDIAQGEFLAITGPSGSGKSTMMNIVGCLDIPSRGEVTLSGENIATLGDSGLAQLRGRKIGFVFQQFNLIPTLSAIENVMLPLEFQDAGPGQANRRAIELLNIVGLGDRMHHRPGQLSGGQMQRVAIARALAVDPDIILADEPTGNLDSASGRFIMDFFSRIHKERGKTIIIVTHDPNLVEYAERVVRLKDGRIEGQRQNRKKVTS